MTSVLHFAADKLSFSSFALHLFKSVIELVGVGSKPLTTLLGSRDVRLLVLGRDLADVMGNGLAEDLRSKAGELAFVFAWTSSGFVSALVPVSVKLLGC